MGRETVPKGSARPELGGDDRTAGKADCGLSWDTRAVLFMGQEGEGI